MTEPKEFGLAALGRRIKAAVKASGKTQREISAHFSITEQAVSQWAKNLEIAQRDQSAVGAAP